MRFPKDLLENEAVERYIRLKLLNFVIRPARNLEKAEAIAATESQIDHSLSVLYRKMLNVARLKSCYVPTAFGQMHYYDSAPGSSETPLVLLHGIGSSGQCFSVLGEMFRSKQRVIIPDLFHFSGFSQANNPVMTVTEHADSLIEFLESFSFSGPVHLCALSLGGWIAMKAAAAKPALFLSLVLLNSAGPQIRPLQLRDNLLYLSWKKFQTLYPGLMCASPYMGVPLLSSASKRSLYRILKHESVRNLVKSVRTEDFVDSSVARITCPVLVLWGREDKLLSARIPQYLAHNLSNCEARWVENCAHILCMEAPSNVFLDCCRFWKLDSTPDSWMAKVILKTFPVYPETPVEVESGPHGIFSRKA
jgi:pimeloyl-ACP methyl ester carboxylesterase